MDILTLRYMHTHSLCTLYFYCYTRARKRACKTIHCIASNVPTCVHAHTHTHTHAHAHTHTLTVHSLLLLPGPLWYLESCYSMIEHSLTVDLPSDQVDRFLLPCVSYLHLSTVLEENLQTKFVTFSSSQVERSLWGCVGGVCVCEESVGVCVGGVCVSPPRGYIMCILTTT